MEKVRYFQYIGSERKGEIVIFEKIETEEEMVFVSFKDGTRCNEDLILPINDVNWRGKLMAEISDPDNLWRFKEEWKGRKEERSELNAEQERVIIQPFVEGKKHTTPIPPRKTTSNFGAITNNIEVPTPEPKVLEPKKQKATGDPVFLMLDKSKKFDTDISLDMTISLPKQSLYAVVDESFDDGGIKMIEYIVEEMDISIIKDALKHSLLEAYKSDDDKYMEEITTIYEPDVVDEPIVGDPIPGDVKPEI